MDRTAGYTLGGCICSLEQCYKQIKTLPIIVLSFFKIFFVIIEFKFFIFLQRTTTSNVLCRSTKKSQVSRTNPDDRPPRCGLNKQSQPRTWLVQFTVSNPGDWGKRRSFNWQQQHKVISSQDGCRRKAANVKLLLYFIFSASNFQFITNVDYYFDIIRQ